MCVPSQESERSWICVFSLRFSGFSIRLCNMCVKGIEFPPLSLIFFLDFGTVLTVRYFFHYITNKEEHLMNSSSLPTLQHYVTNKGEQLMNSSSLPTLQHYITNKGEHLMNSSSLTTLQHSIYIKIKVV